MIDLPTEEPGRYQLRGLLGEGGQALVHLALDVRLGREVAFKRLRKVPASAPGDSSAATREQRFVREAQITAQLDHPGIAPIHELGRQADGTLYATQRLVHGHTLAKALAEIAGAGGGLARRLALLKPLLGACQAVAYAHARGVIHRDLKPENIMLGELGEVVVVDWGVARSRRAGQEPGAAQGADDPAGPASALSLVVTPEGSLGGGDQTVEGATIGTPYYMSPEQAAGAVGQIDERSDVWSLGVVLYELLCGERPFTGPGARAVLFAVAGKPMRPVRAVEPSAPAELAAIVERALQREPARRYQDAGGLAADLDRFLEGQLVQAHLYSRGERLRRWARLHASELVVAAGFTLALLVTGAVSVRRIVIESERANREAQVARQVTEFLSTMFGASKPDLAKGKEVTAREVLDAAVARIEGTLQDDPVLRAQLVETMAKTYFGLGRYGEAQKLNAEAVALYGRAYGADDPRTLAARSRDTLFLVALEQPGQAEKALHELLPVLARVLGPRHAETLLARRREVSALVYLGRVAEALPLAQSTLADLQAAQGAQSAEAASAMNSFAPLYFMSGKSAEGLALLQQAVALDRKLNGPDDPETLRAMSNLGQALTEEGRHAEAEPLLRETLAAKRRVLGPEHPSTLHTAHALSAALLRLGRYGESVREARAALEVLRRSFGKDRKLTLETSALLGEALRKEGQLAASEAELRDALERLQATLGPAHSQTREAEVELALTLAAGAKGDEALALLGLACEHGLPSAALEAAAKDPALAALRDGEPFRALLEKVRARPLAKAGAAP